MEVFIGWKNVRAILGTIGPHRGKKTPAGYTEVPFVNAKKNIFIGRRVGPSTI